MLALSLCCEIHIISEYHINVTHTYMHAQCECIYHNLYPALQLIFNTFTAMTGRLVICFV